MRETPASDGEYFPIVRGNELLPRGCLPGKLFQVKERLSRVVAEFVEPEEVVDDLILEGLREVRKSCFEDLGSDLLVDDLLPRP